MKLPDRSVGDCQACGLLVTHYTYTCMNCIHGNSSPLVFFFALSPSLSEVEFKTGRILSCK